jgi:hypothetical protein
MSSEPRASSKPEILRFLNAGTIAAMSRLIWIPQLRIVLKQLLHLEMYLAVEKFHKMSKSQSMHTEDVR